MLQKLRVKNFKKFATQELDFQEGINIVRGVNEAGKSTLMNAILATLFADVNTKSKSFYSEVTNWKTASPEIYLEALFQLPGKGEAIRSRAEARLVRDFKKKEQFLTIVYPGETASPKKLTDQQEITDALKS